MDDFEYDAEDVNVIDVGTETTSSADDDGASTADDASTDDDDEDDDEVLKAAKKKALEQKNFEVINKSGKKMKKIKIEKITTSKYT